MTMDKDITVDLDDLVFVPFGDDPQATAQRLLGSAEVTDGVDVSHVTTSPLRGGFYVPRVVAEETSEFFKEVDDDVPSESAVSDAGLTAQTEVVDANGSTVPDPEPKALSDLKAADLDALAEAEGIDLTGAKKSNATKVERIEEVRADRASLRVDETVPTEVPDDQTDNAGTPPADSTQE